MKTDSFTQLIRRRFYLLFGFCLVAIAPALVAGAATNQSPVAVSAGAPQFARGHIAVPEMRRPRPAGALPRIASVGTLPASFDLRAQNGLTPVGNQGNCGSCWTFGAFGSLESSLLRSSGQVNAFSEDHLNSFGKGTCCQGGNRYMTTGYLASWAGPVSAADDSYPACDISYSCKNVCGGVATAAVRNHVQEVWWLPVRGGALDNNTIKQAVYAYGAVETAINAEPMVTASQVAYFNSRTSALCNTNIFWPDHSVDIVGWDDNYAVTNFTTQPVGPGAFLMRNSWGTSFGKGGYFWISYYDATVGYDENTLYLNAEAPDNYTRNYQSDYFWNHGFVGYGNSNPAWGANIFTAVGGEQLRAVSFYTTVVNAPYVINVYTNASVSPQGALTIGRLACTTNGTITWPGYHTVRLPQGVDLTPTGQFVIAVQFAGNSQGCIPVDPYTWNTLYNSYQSQDGQSWDNVVSKNQAMLTVCIKGFTYARCNPTIATTVAKVGANGNSGSVTVAANSGCPWTATSNDGWLSLTAGTSGSGTGIVTYVFTTNTTSSVRTGTLTIAGQTFTVTQAFGSGIFSLATNTVAVGAIGNSGSVTVYAVSSFQWTAVANDYWLGITSGASGSGTGIVTFAYSTNAVCSARSGSLTIGGQTVTVNQAAGTGTLVLLINGTPTNAATAGATASCGLVQIGTTPDSQTCPWTATANNDWLSISSGADGIGPGWVKYCCAGNPACGPRTGTLTIASQPVTITQAGGSGTFTLSPTTTTAAATGKSGSLTVFASSTCQWTATSNNGDWLSITGGASGNGTGTVSYTCTANSSCSQRIGTLTIAGQTFTVTQAGGIGSFSLSTTSVTVGAPGNSGSVTVSGSSGCTWTATSNNDWLNITAGVIGSGAGTVNYTCAANPSCAARSGSLMIAGQTVTINQNGTPGNFSLSATTTSVGAVGSCGSVTVYGNSGCPWVATSGNSWLAISPGSGSGTGTVTYCYATNTIPTARSGSLTIAGQTFTVTQAGASASGSFSLSTTNVAIGAVGNCGSVTVYSTGSIPFTATTSNSWLRISAITGAGAGNGNAVGSGNVTVIVNYCCDTNPACGGRIGSLIIAGQTVTVTQAGGTGTFTLSETNATVSAAGNCGSVLVSTTAGCPWTATTTNNWLSIASGASGTGTGVVNYCYTTNLTSNVRTGSLTIASQKFTLIQTGLPPVTITVVTNSVEGTDGAARFSLPQGALARPAGLSGELTSLGGFPIIPVGVGVSFIAEGTGLTCAWNFGDGSTSTDCNPAHVYTNCGPHNVQLALSDGTLTLVSNQTVVVACDLAMTGLKLNLNFARHTAACVATARLSLAPTFSVTNQVLVLDVAGAQSTFVLNNAGRGINSQGVCRLVYQRATGDWQLTANLVGDATWLTAWAEAGLSNTTVRWPGRVVAVPVQLLVGTDAALATTNLHYTATTGRTGQTR